VPGAEHRGARCGRARVIGTIACPELILTHFEHDPSDNFAEIALLLAQRTQADFVVCFVTTRRYSVTVSDWVSRRVERALVTVASAFKLEP
jgi:hypothetical protein